MINKRISKNPEPSDVKLFHEVFPFALEWFIKEGKRKLQHNAYFPYDDYRERYYKKYRKDTSIVSVRKYPTEPRTD